MPPVNLENIVVELLLKNIKNIHIRIYPPLGRVRVSAPRRMNLEKIRNFISSKLSWIKEQQSKILSRKWQAPQEYKTGESHYFFGQKYLLEVIEVNKKPHVKIANETLILQVRPRASKKQKQLVLQEFYRLRLKEIAAQMIRKFEVEMKVEVKELGVKKMKTRWGTCNPRAKRIWINLELAKSPLECLEHIVVHEMVHLLARKHDAKFFGYMDQFLPQWKEYKKMLTPDPSLEI